MYVVDFVRSKSVEFETLLHRPASSATKLASSLHVPGQNVAKTVLVKADECFVLAVLPATSRIDLNRLGSTLLIDPELIRLATTDEIHQTFHDCEPGTMPPFGRLYGLKTIVDAGFDERESIVFGTNTRHQGMRMQFQNYVALAEPLRAAFGQPIDPPGLRSSPRSRGRCAGVIARCVIRAPEGSGVHSGTRIH
jgi:Ala-tRNA(Pro) deacylase